MELLKRTLREAPIVDMGDYDYLVHPVTDGIPLVEPALLREIVDGFTSMLDLEGVEKLVTPEAMGIHHTTALSLRTGIPFVVVRKRSYGLPGEVAVHQETGYSSGDLFINNLSAGDRIVLVDDVFSTGGTLEAVCEALLGMDVEIADVVVVLRRGEHPDGFPVPVRSLLEIDVVDGEVVIND